MRKEYNSERFTHRYRPPAPATSSCNQTRKPKRLRKPWKSSIAVRCLCLFAAALVVINLFYLGAKPIAVGLFVAPWDKVAHFTVFSLITALLSFGSRQRIPITIVLAVALIGGLDEIHQSILPGREADVWDFLTDVAAAVCTTYLLQRVGLQTHEEKESARN